MLARTTLIVLALASPAWAGPDDYPAGLFEHSPLNDTPAAISHGSHSAPGQAMGRTRPASAPAGACHHYRVWSYPWPQPLCETSAPSPPEQAKNLPNELADGACHHYRVWSYPWPQPC